VPREALKLGCTVLSAKTRKYDGTQREIKSWGVREKEEGRGNRSSVRTK
jgi:hypothetical protein